MFSVKKLLRKTFMFGVSAAITLSFCQPFVKAAPANTDQGATAGTTTIGKATATVTVTPIESPGTYDANAKQLIDSAAVTGVNGAISLDATGQDVELYLRVKKSDGSFDSKWVKYTGTTDLESTGSLVGTNAGEYTIYYYLVGGNNYKDITTTPAP